jgi:hypothetical protein
MDRMVGGFLVLLLALPPLWAEDKPKDKEKGKSATPAEQYNALLKEWEAANTAFYKAFQEAKDPEIQTKIFNEQNPRQKFSAKFFALAEKHPKDPIAIDALIWILTGASESPNGKGLQPKVITILMRDHIQSPKLGKVCESMAYGFDKNGEALLRAVLDKSENKAVRAEACLALAQRLRQKASTVKRLKDDPASAKLYEKYYGKELIADLLKTDLAKLQAESEKTHKTLSDKYLADMTVDRLKQLAQNFSYSSDKTGEALLRTLMEKDARREVKGVACLALGQVLKQQADAVKDDAKAALKIRGESEKLLERAADKFADVKLPYRGTVGSKAKGELFELRFLAIGKTAPEVAGEDQDGKKFKLSDYKGKVVFLDFWSQY